MKGLFNLNPFRQGHTHRN